MDRTEFLKARVSKNTKETFEKICERKGRNPTTKLREMIEEYIEKEGEMLSEVDVDIYRPSGYEYGAWKVSMKLCGSTHLSFQDTPIPFSFPKWNKRWLKSDDDYRAAVFVKNAAKNDVISSDVELGGKFVDGAWHGHLYTNGISEEENPTPIEKVKSDLIDSMNQLIKRYKSISQ